MEEASPWGMHPNFKYTGMWKSLGIFGSGKYGGGAHPVDLKKDGKGEETVAAVS